VGIIAGCAALLAVGIAIFAQPGYLDPAKSRQAWLYGESHWLRDQLEQRHSVPRIQSWRSSAEIDGIVEPASWPASVRELAPYDVWSSGESLTILEPFHSGFCLVVYAPGRRPPLLASSIAPLPFEKDAFLQWHKECGPRPSAAQQSDAADGALRRYPSTAWRRVRIRAPAPQLICVFYRQRGMTRQARGVFALVSLSAIATWSCHIDGRASSQFTVEKFRALPDGASKAEAIAALGEPIGKWSRKSHRVQGELEVWSFRDQDNGFGTWHAVLEFDSTGKVFARDLNLRDDDH
jgi:hypothetical protein